MFSVVTNFDISDFKTVMWCIIAGVILALVYIFYKKMISGSIVRALIDNEAFTQDSAKTPVELGFSEDSSAISSANRSDAIKRIITYDGEKITPDTKIYIKDGMKSRAEAQFGLRGNELFVIIGGAAAIVILGALITAIF